MCVEASNYSFPQFLRGVSKGCCSQGQDMLKLGKELFLMGVPSFHWTSVICASLTKHRKRCFSQNVQRFKICHFSREARQAVVTQVLKYSFLSMYFVYVFSMFSQPKFVRSPISVGNSVKPLL